MNKFKNEAVPGLKDIFPDETRSIQELIADISLVHVLKVIGWFTIRVDQGIDNQNQVLDRWLGLQDTSTRRAIEIQFHLFTNKSGSQIFYESTSSLFLLDEALQLNCPKTSETLTAEQELNLFKAYLAASSLWIKKQNDAKGNIQSTGLDGAGDLTLVAGLITQQSNRTYHEMNVLNLKAYSFFRFCEGNDQLKPVLAEFLLNNGLTDFKEWLRTVNTFFAHFYTNGNPILNVDEAQEPLAYQFINRFCIDVENYESKDDFTTIKAFPVFKDDDGRFIAYHLQFLLDKVFNSLLWDFATIAKKQGIAKDLPDFKNRYYSELHVEQELFSEHIIKPAQASQYDKILSGTQIDSLCKEKGPDAYLKFSNKVLLIEFKDALFPGGIKWSMDLSKVKEHINMKLAKFTNKNAKGLGQMKKWLEKSEDGFCWDKDVIPANCTVYPMLIVSDLSYTSAGVEYHLRKFQSELKVGSWKELKPPVLLNLDQLVQYSNVLSNNEWNLFNLIDDYYQWIRPFSNKNKNTLLSFGHYSEVRSLGTHKQLFDFDLLN